MQARSAKPVQVFLKFIITIVINEPDGPAARSRIVNHLRYQYIVAMLVTEVELITNPDFTGRVHQNIPEAGFAVELTQEENLNVGAGFFLLAVQTGGEYLGIVENHGIALVEVLEDIFERPVFDFT